MEQWNCKFSFDVTIWSTFLRWHSSKYSNSCIVVSQKLKRRRLSSRPISNQSVNAKLLNPNSLLICSIHWSVCLPTEIAWNSMCGSPENYTQLTSFLLIFPFGRMTRAIRNRTISSMSMVCIQHRNYTHHQIHFRWWHNSRRNSWNCHQWNETKWNTFRCAPQIKW